MPSIDDALTKLRFLSEKGRGSEKCHIVLVEQDAKERIKNDGPRPKTQFRLETDDPAMYSRLNELKDRWFGIANKSVALSVMARMWDMEEEWIRKVCDDAQTAVQAR